MKYILLIYSEEGVWPSNELEIARVLTDLLDSR